jgi:hypothetical protein
VTVTSRPAFGARQPWEEEDLNVWFEGFVSLTVCDNTGPRRHQPVKTYCVTSILYACYSAVRLGMCNSARLVQLPCYKCVKTSADRVKRLVWRDCALCKAAIV